MSTTLRSPAAIGARAKAIEVRLSELEALPTWAAEHQAEFDALSAEIDTLRTEKARGTILDGYRSGRFATESADITDDGRRSAHVAGEANRTIETAVRAALLPDDAAQKATHLLEHAGTPTERGIVGRWIAATGSEAYLGAFRKLAADFDRGHLLWDPAELEAYQRVARLRTELRAMGIGTDSAGGYMVPFVLDPAILLTSAGSISPLRRISRVVQTVGDAWNGVTSAGVTAEWLAEAAEAADASPTLAQPSIAVHKGSAFVPYSLEVGRDAVDFVSEIGRLLVDAADQLQAVAYVTGNGSGKPFGIVTALDDTTSEIDPTTPETFAAADVYKTQNALGPRFQPGASWIADLATINSIAQFETTSGALAFPELENDRLLRRPIYECSPMRSTADINTAATAENPILVYGDFANFVIVDAIGTTIEPVPHLFGTNHRPTGQRGLFMFFRTGADSVNDGAFVLLDVDTAA